MSDERRYDEAEVQEILERATSAERSGAAPLRSSSQGLTLAQLQDIGREVGIPPERIADAAHAVAYRVPVADPRTFMGAPRFISRIVPIPRPLDDREWSRLVVDLRETFGAKGRIEGQGSLRSWSNGNLQVHVEPNGDGYCVRMQTFRGDASARAAMGFVTLGMSGLMLLMGSLNGFSPAGLMIPAAVGLVGVAQLGYLRAQLPRWGAIRSEQMDALAARITHLLDAPEKR